MIIVFPKAVEPQTPMNFRWLTHRAKKTLYELQITSLGFLANFQPPFYLPHSSLWIFILHIFTHTWNFASNLCVASNLLNSPSTFFFYKIPAARPAWNSPIIPYYSIKKVKRIFFFFIWDPGESFSICNLPLCCFQSRYCCSSKPPGAFIFFILFF